ncbi:MAG TPA: hypothetical protein PLO62_02990 [Candidatus Hydrogenedentes bacterium]|mgnify:CR=1 FL=1|nr:hypothetical protein [Candidatus Hydrogenedentota bacterium]HOS04182.1 hypothetical protein [Candidatus Hydrogenedentota bacterium]
MRKVSVILALLSCTCLIGCPSTSGGTGLVGKWLYMDPAGSGVGIKFDFRSTGRFSLEIITPQTADRLAARGTYTTDTTVTPNEIMMLVDGVGAIENGKWKWFSLTEDEQYYYYAIYELLQNGKLAMEISEYEMPTEFTGNAAIFTRQ